MLCVCATLLLAATSGHAADFPANSHQRWDAKGPYTLGSESSSPASCPMKLRPSGQCVSSGADEGEECPFQITLPPLTIQLPKQFRLLEKTIKEVQSLKEAVNKLRSGCHECRGTRGSGAFGQQQAEVQRDAGEEVRQDLTGQEVLGGSSVEERGDGMVPGTSVDGTGLGHGSGFGKQSPSPSTMQEMQVRNLRRIEEIKAVINKTRLYT